MTTQETVQQYFDRLRSDDGWASVLAEDMEFTSFGTPSKQVTGREKYLESTKRFYGMIRNVDVRELMVDGSKACALTQYQLEAPNGAQFTSDVAEFFEVRDGEIARFDIYFDSAPYAKLSG